MKQIFSVILSIILSLLGINSAPYDLEPLPLKSVSLTSAQVEFLENIVESETAWLASLQLENGAIPMTHAENGTVKMNPYFADFAALALLDRPEEYKDNVIKYMDWHFSHLNTSETDYNGVDGTIYDYNITLADGKITSESVITVDDHGTYDSTDSYAATFLMVLQKYYEKTGDKEYLLSHVGDIERISGAMTSTLHNGLTNARPDVDVKYLMDNCEVYAGALAASDVFSAIGDSKNEEKFISLAAEISTAVENKLWCPVLKHYKPGINKVLGTSVTVFSWNEFYPSATAQLFPVSFGLIAPNTERAELLYNKFCENYNWENLEIPDAFYWGSNVYAAAIMGDLDRALTYMTHYTEVMKTHAYPLYNADAAKVSMAAQLMIDSY